MEEKKKADIATLYYRLLPLTTAWMSVDEEEIKAIDPSLYGRFGSLDFAGGLKHVSADFIQNDPGAVGIG